jgi:putative Mg2+ transporter-C (MgtC) family protein
LRLLAACLLGALIGVEREWRRKPAGLRTHIMVAAGACLFCLLTLELLQEAEARASSIASPDPIRIISAVTSGVAFLAAGTIITSGNRVIGLTTGAGMWVAGAIGVACGLGHIALAGLATGIVLVILVAIGKVERAMPGSADADLPDDRDG